MEEAEESPVRFNNEAALRLLKVYLPYVAIIVLSYANIKQHSDNKDLQSRLFKAQEDDINDKREALKVWRTTDANTRDILLKIVQNRKGGKDAE